MATCSSQQKSADMVSWEVHRCRPACDGWRLQLNHLGRGGPQKVHQHRDGTRIHCSRQVAGLLKQAHEKAGNCLHKPPR